MSKRSRAFILLSIIILLTALIALLTVIYYDKKTETMVQTSSGKIVGITVDRLGNKINCYFGVPYAEPPVGPLRFSKPIPKKPWTGKNIFNISFFQFLCSLN